MIAPFLIGLIGVNRHEMRVKLLFLGRYIVEGIYFHDQGKLYIVGDSLGQALGLHEFMDLMIDDFWLEFFSMNEIELTKHHTHGFIFRLNN